MVASLTEACSHEANPQERWTRSNRCQELPTDIQSEIHIKLVERLISLQLTEFLERNNLLPKFQSGFRKRHSTETALLKVMSDILLAADQGHVTLLGLLEMSAAFDTVDLDILLFHLKTSFGVDGTVLSWLESFLRDRTQQVAFNGKSSALVKVTFVVLQGSILGPLLFLLYTADIIPSIATKH